MNFSISLVNLYIESTLITLNCREDLTTNCLWRICKYINHYKIKKQLQIKSYNYDIYVNFFGKMYVIISYINIILNTLELVQNICFSIFIALYALLHWHACTCFTIMTKFKLLSIFCLRCSNFHLGINLLWKFVLIKLTKFDYLPYQNVAHFQKLKKSNFEMIIANFQTFIDLYRLFYI
jgi:hypothetical protein